MKPHKLRNATTISGYAMMTNKIMPPRKLLIKSALSRYLLAYPENHPDVADVYLNLGNVHGQEGQLDTFILYQTKALQIWQFFIPRASPPHCLGLQ